MSKKGNLTRAPIKILGTLSKYDDDGSEKITKKMNLRPFKLIASIWNR